MIIVKPYNRERAVEYARRWAMQRNPLFIDYTGKGGDCTNFVSQAIYAGSCVMNYTETFGWYYISDSDRAPAWTGVEYFYRFMTGVPDFAPTEGRAGPFGALSERDELQPGDVVQLADNRGDYYHTLLITDITNDDILVAAHSDDSLERPLSTYNFASSRFIKILGVNMEYQDPQCFEGLINGESI